MIATVQSWRESGAGGLGPAAPRPRLSQCPPDPLPSSLITLIPATWVKLLGCPWSRWTPAPAQLHASRSSVDRARVLRRHRAARVLGHRGRTGQQAAPRPGPGSGAGSAPGREAVLGGGQAGAELGERSGAPAGAVGQRARAPAAAGSAGWRGPPAGPRPPSPGACGRAGPRGRPGSGRRVSARAERRALCAQFGGARMSCRPGQARAGRALRPPRARVPGLDRSRLRPPGLW